MPEWHVVGSQVFGVSVASAQQPQPPAQPPAQPPQQPPQERDDFAPLLLAGVALMAISGGKK